MSYQKNITDILQGYLRLAVILRDNEKQTELLKELQFFSTRKLTQTQAEETLFELLNMGGVI